MSTVPGTSSGSSVSGSARVTYGGAAAQPGTRSGCAVCVNRALSVKISTDQDPISGVGSSSTPTPCSPPDDSDDASSVPSPGRRPDGTQEIHPIECQGSALKQSAHSAGQASVWRRAAQACSSA